MKKKLIVILIILSFVALFWFFSRPAAINDELVPVLSYFDQEIPEKSPIVFGILHKDITPDMIQLYFKGRDGDVYDYNSLKEIKYVRGMYLAVIIFDRNSPYAKGIQRDSAREWNVFISRSINKLELRGQKYFPALKLKTEIYLTK